MNAYKKLQKAKTQGGFTLIELLIVIGILAILLAITLIALNPTQHFQGARNAQRSSDVTAILDGIYEYEAAHNGNLPASVSGATATPAALGSDTVGGDIDPCADLIPAYLADMPLDPDSSFGTKTPSTGAACSATSYETGYQIAKSGANRFTVSAPHAENATISVTR